MGNNKLLLLGGLGVGAYLLVKGANVLGAVKRLEYTNPKIKVGRLSLGGLALEMKLDFINHSSEAISIEYFTGQMYYEGKNLASFTFNANGKNLTIAPRTTTTIPFSVQLKTWGAIQVISRLIQALNTHSSISTVMAVEGSFYAAGVDIPVSYAYDLKSQTLVSMGKKNSVKN